MPRTPTFGHLVLKPTLACTASCRTCASRKALHALKRREDLLGLPHWKSLFREVDGLGITKLTLSGGEPTLYRDLVPLIGEGRSYGWEIGLNTNGSLVDDALARRLHAAGLNGATVSIYSATSDCHDRIRRHPGLWRKAGDAVSSFVRVREEVDPSFRVTVQTILSRDNYRQFPDLLRLAYELRACSLVFSYLEDDYREREYLLGEEQLREFREQVIPAAVRVAERFGGDRWIRRLASSALSGLYPPRVSAADYAAGVYRAARPCEVPSYASIVLASGDVHPCNMVEYSHEPVIGNLRDASFAELWRGREWAAFRKRGFDRCRYCPVPLQALIPITRRPGWPGAQHLLHASRLSALVPRLKRAAYSSRWLFRTTRRR